MYISYKLGCLHYLTDTMYVVLSIEAEIEVHQFLHLKLYLGTEIIIMNKPVGYGAVINHVKLISLNIFKHI